jgi:hypothetical protein
VPRSRGWHRLRDFRAPATYAKKKRGEVPLTDPATIIVHVPDGDSLVSPMNGIRSWLDGNKVQPREFNPVSDGRDRAYAIAFASIDDATRFRLQFVDLKPR